MNAQNAALVALLQPFVGQSGTLTRSTGEAFSGTLVVLNAVTSKGEGMAKLVRATDKHVWDLTLDRVVNVCVMAACVEVEFKFSGEQQQILRFER